MSKYFKTAIFLLTFCVLILACTKPANNDSVRLDQDNSKLDYFNNDDQDTSKIRTMASILYNSEQFKEALIEYDKLIKLDSLEGQFYFRKAVCAAQILKDSVAEFNFKRSINLNYRTFDAYMNLGLIYMSTFKNDAKAIECFEKCIQIDPTSQKAKTFLDGLRNNK